MEPEDPFGLAGQVSAPARERSFVAMPMFFTAAEASELLRLDESTLYRHLRSGAFPGLKIGGRYVVPRAVIERLVADVLSTGRCVDLSSWTDRWRREQQARIEQAGLGGVELPGAMA